MKIQRTLFSIADFFTPADWSHQFFQSTIEQIIMDNCSIFGCIPQRDDNIYLLILNSHSSMIRFCFVIYCKIMLMFLSIRIFNNDANTLLGC